MFRGVPTPHNVLVVDERSDGLRAARVLRQLGHHATVAVGRDVALAAVRRWRFAVVVCGVRGPDGAAEGGGLLAAMRRADPGLRAVAVTGYGVPPGECEAAGFDARVVSPATADEMSAALRRAGAGGRGRPGGPPN